MQKHSRLGAGVVIAAAVLAGCATTPAPAPSRSSQAAPETPTPSPTPTPTRPALDELALDPGGLGYIRLGSPVPEVDPALAIVEWDGTACQWEGQPAEGEPFAGYWRSVDPADTTLPFPADRDPYLLLTEWGVREGPVTSVRVYRGVTTAEGVGPGSTRGDLIAAYGGSLHLADDRGSTTVYTVTEGTGRIVFEVAKSDGYGSWEPQLIDKVLWMWAESSERELRSIAATDAAGPAWAPSGRGAVGSDVAGSRSV